MLDGKLVLVDDDGKPPKPKVNDPINADSDSEVDEVFNETASFMASTSSKVNKSSKNGSGVGNKSLYKTWKETYNEDPYDDDYFVDCGLTDGQMKFANAFDISLRVPLFSISKPCSACSKVFMRDIYGDHVSGILAGKEVDIGLGEGYDKPLRHAVMLLYSCEEGLDVYVNLTGSSPLTQTGMVDFVPGRAVIDTIYQKDAVTLLKRIQKFSMTQDIRGRAAVHIFNRINLVIANGVGAQLMSNNLNWRRNYVGHNKYSSEAGCRRMRKSYAAVKAFVKPRSKVIDKILCLLKLGTMLTHIKRQAPLPASTKMIENASANQKRDSKDDEFELGGKEI
ncbi:hypothetical protein Tco_1165565 [Tanacetum coccineum]